MERRFFIAMLALVTSGCMSQSGVQGKYTEQQNVCREAVARASATAKQAPNSTEGRAAIGVQFSDCMNKAGWRVAMPRVGTPVASQNPPTGSPSTNPSAATAVAQVPGPAQTSSVSPSEGTAALTRWPHPVADGTPGPAQTPVVNPPSGAPSVNPSAAAARITPAPARYQPARPTLQVPAYGQGGGRNF